MHAGGIVDLSVGTPVDPVPATVRDALASAANSPGYPQTAGTPQLRDAAAGWLAREHGVSVEPGAVLPVIGTKEIIASLPVLLGCGPGDTVVYPELATPPMRSVPAWPAPRRWRPTGSRHSARSGSGSSG